MKLAFGEQLRLAQERGRERQRQRILKHVAHARKFREKPKSKTFRCGHPRTPENSFSNGKYPRCLICKREQAAQWAREQYEPKFRLVPIYKDARDSKTLLEQMWRGASQRESVSA